MFFANVRFFTLSGGWTTAASGLQLGANERQHALSPLLAGFAIIDIRSQLERVDLLTLYELATDGDPREGYQLADDVLLQAIEQALCSGRILLVPESRAGSSDPAPSGGSLARLADAAMQGRPVLQLRGGSYKLYHRQEGLRRCIALKC